VRREELRESLWVIPTAAVVTALALGYGLSLVEVSPDGPLDRYLFQGDAETARGLLSVFIGAFVTVTGVVFSSTIVALQIASQQFSPRLLRTFLRDGGTQGTLAAFLAVLAYMVAVLQGLSPEQSQTPAVAMTVALVLSLANVGVLVYFVHHITRSIRVEAIMLGVERETVRAIRQAYPEPADGAEPPATADPPPEATSVVAQASGYIQAVDVAKLVEVLVAAGACVQLHAKVGTHVARGELLAWMWPLARDGSLEDPDRLVDAVQEALELGFDRDMQQEVTFGLGQLVDISNKALSPAVNDPRTAVESIHHLGVILCELGSRRLGWLVGTDERGRPRVLVQRPSFSEYLGLACDQPRRYGAKEPVVMGALLDLLGNCAPSVDPSRKEDLRRHVRLVLADAEREIAQPADIERIRAKASTAEARIEALCGAAGSP